MCPGYVGLPRFDLCCRPTLVGIDHVLIGARVPQWLNGAASVALVLRTNIVVGVNKEELRECCRQNIRVIPATERVPLYRELILGIIELSQLPFRHFPHVVRGDLSPVVIVLVVRLRGCDVHSGGC